MLINHPNAEGIKKGLNYEINNERLCNGSHSNTDGIHIASPIVNSSSGNSGDAMASIMSLSESETERFRMSTQQRLSRIEKLVESFSFDVPIQNRKCADVTAENGKEVHIRNVCCDAFGITLHQFVSRNRTMRFCNARFATALLLSEADPEMTLSNMARWLGKAEHTGAMHSLKRAKELMEPGVDSHFAAKVNLIRSKIGVDNIR